MMHLFAAETATWSAQMRESLTHLWAKCAAFVPNLLGTLVILVVGYCTSKLLQRAATVILRKLQLDAATEKTGLRETLQHVGIQAAASEIVGKLVFWLFMLTFLISAADALGLPNVSQTIDSFVGYLPNVIGAALIVVVGLVVANFLSSVAQGGAERIGLDYSKALGRLVYGMLVVVVASLALGQLHIETALLNRLIEITLIAVGAALAISLGFGTRDTARNVVAGVYARELYRPGAKLIVGEDRGRVEAVGAVTTKIKTDNGQFIYIPNGQLTELLVREEPDT